MISREHRFHGQAAISKVYRSGQTVRGPLFSLRYSKNSRRQTYRAAVVVSRKVDKSAVVRNRIRRRLYEAIRQFEPDIKEPFDIVVTVFHASTAEEPSSTVTSQLKSQLGQAGILVKRVK